MSKGRRFPGAVTSVTLAVSVLVSAAAGARADAGLQTEPVFLTEAGPASPTKAWAAWCAAQPRECAADPLEPRAIPLTPSLRQLIQSVNLAVNRSVTAVTDQDQWGIADRWDYPVDGRGDCEDIQIEKRRLLAQAGIPFAAMRMAMVINPEGEGHAVLVVRTDKGDLVLDNRVNAVKPWYRTGYTWVKWETLQGPEWVSLGGVRIPVETAAKD